MTVMVCVAHPGDEILGAGGTIAKYVREGEMVVVVVFSYGEGNDPMTDPVIVTHRRIREAKKALDTLGCRDTIFFSFADSKLPAQIKEPEVAQRFQVLLKRYKPRIIITQPGDDLELAHKSVANFVWEQAKTLKHKLEIYEFYFSLPFRTTHRTSPRLYVDISKTFGIKKEALRKFKSQRLSVMIYSAIILFQNWLAGFKAGCRYAEVFYKV